MLGLKLVRLIEGRAEMLAQGLTEQIRKSERTRDFCKIPPEELQRSAAELYRNLGAWLLRKTESDIEDRFKAIGTRRAGEGIGLDQFVWALMRSRDHLWHFLQREAFADNALQLYAELELHQLLNQFFDRAVYYGVLAYQKATEQDRCQSDSSLLRLEPDHWLQGFAVRPGTKRRTRIQR